MLNETELILVVVGFMLAFVLAFGLGANDVANSFGTSVGSKVLTLKTACVLAAIFEVSGSVLLGGQVSSTIRGGIINPELFGELPNGALVLMYGQLASLTSACIWMLVATFFKLPVSGSHSIVGATAGFGLVLFGLSGIQWMGILSIVLSWFISPVLSGIIAAIIFFIVKKVVLSKENPLEPGLNILPFLYGVTVIINVFSVLYKGLSIFGVSEIPLWIVLVTSFAAGIVTGLIVFFFVRPCLRRKILRHMSELERAKEEGYEGPEETRMEKFKKRFTEVLNTIRHPSLTRKKQSSDFADRVDQATVAAATTQLEPVALTQDSNDSSQPEVLITENPILRQGPNNENDEGDTTQTSETSMINDETAPVIVDRPEEVQVFSFAQILTASFDAFVHGANDVSNAIGPVVGLWLVAISGNPLNSASPPVWILFYGGVGISIGLWMWGYKVMETIGSDLTTITPSSGVCIELGSAITVLIASNLGIPVSTTHCQVGSVVSVGRCRSKFNVNWRLFVNIIVAWIVTLPVTAGLSALVMYAFTQTQSLLAFSN